ncbi:homospermidine synthase [Pseudomonas sp. N040]|uniref:homospermidine synthase n=1 Tax=Pseudomonas sp. N040 TaxID=2785325 RepID=UPI0018A30918|nr:saccharopine dehydrogenase C-terminal domain-containing protein [Pseudomonas sp. N040]MBF7731452.1 homospermidine synthase [Pseudomonas sp. N040]MBW7015096.1 saccharopine dehydrogenase NADP-binding domain-containing protein [Pseudomonas sp. N040]
MSAHKTHTAFSGRLVMLGFGSIGRGVLPLILRHIDIQPAQISILSANQHGIDLARGQGVNFRVQALSADNLARVLEPLLGPGDCLLNLSVAVSSLALIRFCHPREVLYLDACIEPWAGGYTDPNLSTSQRSNYALREAALTLGRELGKGPTAVVTHGANPGLVSHLVKQALLDIARDTGVAVGDPRSREDWAGLARRLEIRVIHIAERDTQISPRRRQLGEFVNTWSVDGFIGESCQPAELGWGSHERHWPENARRHAFGSGCAIYLMQPGAATRVRTWTPQAGPFHAFLISHSEALSLADYLSVSADGGLLYRPTVHYAYHPCDDAVLSLHELAGRNWVPPEHKRILGDEISAGSDELGVLLAGHGRNAYWYGSLLSDRQARALAPNNSATTLQVTAGILGGLVWAMENPRCGLVEPEAMDFRRVLEISRPYLGQLAGHYSEWNPLQDRGRLFPEQLDNGDPWQFLNIEVC